MSRSLYARLARRFDPPDPMTRRQMLGASLAAASGVLLSGCRAPSRNAHRGSGGSVRRVVVIGGGFAGLACAYELASAGIDVRVLEARSRLGGRVVSFSDFIPGAIVEGGGELIGSNHPTWVAYADRFGLGFRDVTEDEDASFPVFIGDRLLGEAEVEALYDEMNQAVALMNADARTVDADEPWRARGAARLDARPTSDWIDGLAVSALTRAAMHVMFTADNGAPTREQSYLGNLAQVAGGGVDAYWTESEVYRCQEGNQALAMKLAEAIGPDRILLKTPVSGVTHAIKNASVTASSGQVFECDDVVLAVPPSVWDGIAFDPPLEMRSRMGSNVKYLAAVEGRFWREQGLAPDGLSDGIASMTWDGTDNQAIGPEAELVAFSGGPASESARAIPAAARDAAYAEALEPMFPGFSGAFRRSRFMDWPGDPWTRAGYSFPAPGEVTRLGPVLREGAYRLHFAGEHACPAFVGYMEGALSSGASVARRIAGKPAASVAR